MENESVALPGTSNLGQELACLRETLFALKGKTHALTFVIGSLENSDNFVSDQLTAIQAIIAFRNVSGGDLGAIFRRIGGEFEDAAHRIFEGFCSEDPITPEGLAKVDQWLPTDQLSQYRYLAIYEWATAVHLIKDARELVETVHPNALVKASPDDMHARTVLTRTYGYLQTLKDQEAEDWFYSTMRIISDFGDTFENNIMSDINDIDECIASHEIQEIAANAITNPAHEKTLLNCLESMRATVKKIDRFIDVAMSITHMYDELAQVLIKSNEAIQAAYKIYLECNQIDF